MWAVVDNGGYLCVMVGMVGIGGKWCWVMVGNGEKWWVMVGSRGCWWECWLVWWEW